MPVSNGPQSSCSNNSAKSCASLWHQLSRPATTVMLWLWHKTAPIAVPSSAPGAALFPGELTSSLPLSKGGLGFVHVPTQIQALQAKVISRLLEPERLAWKVFQLHHLSRASQFQPLGYWASIPFSTLNTDQLQLLKRTALLQQADFSACCQLSYHQQCLRICCISDSSAKAPYAFSGHH